MTETNPEETPEAGYFGGPQTILVVDDEEDIRHVLRDTIEAYIDGVQVMTAANGNEALKLLKDTNVELIITDYKMPGMNGLQFLEAARRLVPNVPRILITAYPDLELAVKAINEEHISSFIPKPLTRENVVQTVSSILHERRSAVMRNRAFAAALDSMNKEISHLRKPPQE